MAILVMFLTNCLNGFSAINIISDFYFILFNILNTTFTVGALLIFDQDVAWNFEKSNKISEEYLSLPKKENEN